MSKDTAPQKRSKSNAIREDRLKAALKANMARRKAQARARKPKAQTGNGQSGQDKED